MLSPSLRSQMAGAYDMTARMWRPMAAEMAPATVDDELRKAAVSTSRRHTPITLEAAFGRFDALADKARANAGLLEEGEAA